MKLKLGGPVVNYDIRIHRVTYDQFTKLALERTLVLTRSKPELFYGRVLFQIYNLKKPVTLLGIEFDNFSIIAEGEILSHQYSKRQIIYKFGSVDINPFPDSLMIPKPCIIL